MAILRWKNNLDLQAVASIKISRDSREARRADGSLARSWIKLKDINWRSSTTNEAIKLFVVCSFFPLHPQLCSHLLGHKSIFTLSSPSIALLPSQNITYRRHTLIRPARKSTHAKHGRIHRVRLSTPMKSMMRATANHNVYLDHVSLSSRNVIFGNEVTCVVPKGLR